jgi:alpha-tubulin suppressor-like RCC1 family protein
MAVITGNYHTCFLSPAGTVSCFGGGNLGQLGNGSLSNSLSPVSVSGLTDVGALAAGDDFSCALKKAGLDQGKIFCWGSNIKGQLGTGDYSVRSSPNLVSNLGSIASISAGNNHVCAVKNDGVGYCWGDNTFGQIGDGYTLSSGNLEPTLVSGLGNDARMLVAGGNHACVLKPGGEIMCYGQNTYFQLGASGSILKPSLKAFPLNGFPNTRYLNCPSYFVYSTE